jgi:hypothetical protein
MSAIVAAVTTAEIAAFAAQAIAAANAAALAMSTAAATTAVAAPTIATAAGIGGAMPTAASLSAGAATGIAPGVVAPLIPAVIPTAAGIGGAMPTAAMLSEGAATGIAPGVAPGGLGALPIVATTTAPVVAAEGIAQLAPKAGSVAKPPVIPEPPLAQPNLFSVAEPKPIPRSISPEASPMNRGTSISTDAVKTPVSKSNNAYTSNVVPESSPFNVVGSAPNPAKAPLNPSVTNLSRPVNEAGTDLMMKSIADSTAHRTPLQKAGDYVMDNKMDLALGGLGLAQMMPPSSGSGVNPISETMIRPYTYSEEDTSEQEADPSGREKIRYSSSYTAGTPYKAAQGGLLSLHRGGNFLSGRGDGMSDDIPAMIGTKQPARLADGEFVIPADVVSHIGNGSSKAGAEKLYAMMDKIRQERTGRKRQSPQINAAKYLPR